MATPFLWSDVDSFLGPIGFQPEDFVGLTLRGRDDWEEEEDDEDWEDDGEVPDEVGWEEADRDDEEDNGWDDEEAHGDDWGS